MIMQAVPEAVPAWFGGSIPEFMVYQSLVRRGRVPGVDFIFQSPLMGGRLERGGVVIDFLFNDPPDLAINVQGTYYHYEQGTGVRVRDALGKAQLAGLGVTLIFIDEDDVQDDVDYFVREALQYRDHSIQSRGG